MLMRILKLLLLDLLFLALISANIAAIESYKVDYDIQDNVRVAVSALLTEGENRIYLPLDAGNIAEENNTPYEIISLSDRKIIIFNLAEGREINLHYTTEELIDEGFFVSSNELFEGGTYSMSLKLPEAAILETPLESPKPSVFPLASSVYSDGQRLILEWKSLESGEPVLVKFKESRLDYSFIITAFSMLIIALVLYYIFLRRKNKREKNKKEDSKEDELVEEDKEKDKKGDKEEDKKEVHVEISLYEEEKIIVNALNESNNKEMWQKELLQKTGLTKVKLSRRLRALEERGMIEKIPYGNTNKIRLKRES